jgi:acyl carrier protein
MDMEMASIEQDISAFVKDQFFFGRSEELSPSLSLLGTVVDSTGILVLVSYLQERFGIAVDDDDVVPANFESVASAAAYVAKKLEATV